MQRTVPVGRGIARIGLRQRCVAIEVLPRVHFVLARVDPFEARFDQRSRRRLFGIEYAHNFFAPVTNTPLEPITIDTATIGGDP